MKRPCMSKEKCKDIGNVYIYLHNKKAGSTMAYWVCDKHAILVLNAFVDTIGPVKK